ncbi:hypothetical protein FVA96_24225, partial [Escherichia coli]|nr:hypothetical protein [Escherichia coli]
MSLSDFPSFEYLCVVLKGSPRVLLLIIYRPPKYSAHFFDDFTELLSSISTDFDCLVITGDFNFHTDDLNDKGAKELLTILDTFELSQHVKEATHCKGHTLDLIITKGLIVSDVFVTDPSLSDHFCVFFNISFIPDTSHTSKSNTVKKRYINEHTNVLFKNVISSLPPLIPCHADNLVNNFNSKILNVIDAIAPVTVKTSSSKQKAPWRKAAVVTAQRRERRKAERIWRNTKLHIHHDIYKERLPAYNLDLKSARETFFSNIINNNTNKAKTLFETVDRLTNPPTQIPPELHSTQKCNEFAFFYTDKIEGIRRAINISNKNVGSPPYLGKSNTAMMTSFNAIDSQTLVETVTNLKPSTCCLDALPTNFFKNVFDCLATDVLQIVNNSIQTGHFPKAFKTAVIKPLLKKRSLDASIINNYRPISNLPFISKIIEKVVLQQLNHFLASTGCHDNFQSGFQPLHSTETAFIKVVNDLHL